MSDLYSPVFVKMYEHSNSQLPLGVWARCIGKKLPCFRNNPGSMYNTISLAIKLKGGVNDSDGTVKMRVAPTDSDWYPKLQQALEQMTGERGVDVVDYLGKPIQGLTLESLHHAGELDVVQKRTNKTIRMRTLPKPPAHMSTNKMSTISEWFDAAQDDIAGDIADALTGKTMAEIQHQTARDGALQKTIESSLERSHKSGTGWKTFLQTYAMDNVARDTPVAEKTANLAQSILHHVRKGLAANEEQIRDFHAFNQNKATQEDTLWSQHTASVKTPYKDERSMYLDIAEDALYDRVLARKIGHMIHRGQRIQRTNKYTQNVGRKVRTAPRLSLRRQQNVEHPLKQFYDQHYYPKFKKYPGHVLEKFNAKDSYSAYAGNPENAKQMFRMFTGRNVAVNDTGLEQHTAVQHRLVPLETLSQLDPIDEEMPHLVSLDPIDEEIPHLVPLDAKSEMPRLVPLEQIESEMPRLVPINQKLGANHRLVPIDQDFDSIQSDIADEDLDTDIFGLPNLSAFLPKK